MRVELFLLKQGNEIPAYWQFIPAIAWKNRIAEKTADGVYRYEARNHD